MRLLPAGEPPGRNMIAAGVIDVGISCGVESMSRVPLGSGSKHGPGKPFPDE